jgi:hypothetical protein
LQLIRVEKAYGRIPIMGISNARFIYIRIVVVLVYFIERSELMILMGKSSPLIGYN